MNHLWAPWRMQYVTTADAQDGCVFCALGQQQPDGGNGLLARAPRNFVVLNAFPYNSGHMMVVPYEHQSDFTALAAAALQEMMRLAQVAVAVLQEEFHCEGANLGLNLGRVAGAGIKDHLHLHIVPRWGGDTNFMTTLDHTRVVPQSLEDTWARLSPCLQDALARAGLA